MQHGTSIPRRVIGTVTLDVSTIETIDRDKAATIQAALLVTVVALVGGFGGQDEFGWAGFVVGVILGFAGWLLFSALAYFIGVGFLAGEATEAEAEFEGVLRTVGFAQVPDLLVIFAIVPGGIIGGLTSFAGSVWVVVCSIMALRVSLRVSTARAIAIGLVTAAITIMFATFVLLLV